MIAAFEIQNFSRAAVKNDLNIFANSVNKKMNGVEINGEVFNKGYHSEKLPFTGNGFGGGLETDCVTPEYEFLKDPINNEYGVYDILDGAELYKVTKEGDEVLLAIYKKSPNESSGKFIRLEDLE